MVISNVYVSEIFTSLEGEGPYTGYPTTYVRFAGCNFTCKGFNNPDKLPVINFDPNQYNNIKDLPAITKGCDSIYSVSNKFRHLWKKYTPYTLMSEVEQNLPDQIWESPSGLPYILSLTGGEPTLQQEFIGEFLLEIYDQYYFPSIIIIETNGTIPLKQEFINLLNILTDQHGIKVVWSNSLKLSFSGELEKKAIKPEVLARQLTINNCEQYFKFVVDGSESAIEEIVRIIITYNLEYMINYKNTYLMPNACTNEQLIEVGKKVAEQCIRKGYKYCTRLQNTLWDNLPGT
jgi:6-pyruvoyltetrahydropterin 2'-reductase